MTADAPTITLALTGDVMTGRGIDQILTHPSPPIIYESYVKSALGYVALAEDANGPIQRPAPFAYIWGEALDALRQRRPDVLIVNLETAVTRADRPAPKGINYRMNPDNVGVLTAAGIDCCVLANNHVLDWGEDGLLETLEVLARTGLKTVGAGRTAAEAAAPAIFPLPDKGRVLVYGLACASSGVPTDWAATASRPGVNFLDRPSPAAVQPIAARIRDDRRNGDIVVVSIHWGPNWGYRVDPGDRAFAHGLVEAGVDLVHGHSSHHARPFEMYRDRPILYGCGDFINDYEGIEAHTAYRDDLPLMVVARFAPARRRLVDFDLIPFYIRNFRLSQAGPDDAAWLQGELDRECRRLGGEARLDADGTLRWSPTGGRRPAT